MEDGNPSETRVISFARASRSDRKDLTRFSGQGDRSPSIWNVTVSLTRKSILVVEDDDALRNMMETLFLMEGFDVRRASDGAEALRLVEEHTPDLIVLDLMLPWVNGIEVLAAVRRHRRLADVPVLITTGTATSAFDLRSFSPLHVMHKPLDVDAVVPIVRKLLESSQR